MKKILIIFLLLTLCLSGFAKGIFIEAESFSEKGGWVVDQQFMDTMGSPYLLAHGLGSPVQDAVTHIEVPSSGEWHVYARTYNWTSPWSDAKGPGRFRVRIGEKILDSILGNTGDCWQWQYAGSARLKKGRVELALSDLSGFEGRCDAVYITKNPATVPASDAEELAPFRRQSLNLPAPRVQTFNFVVVGGGVAGMCAAVTAARLGCKVALVNDRPVLGGNNSSEVRVHLGGYSEVGPYEGLGRMIREFGHTRSGNAMPAGYYEDDKKQAFIDEQENVTLFSSFRATDVRMEENIIKAVLIKNIETSEEIWIEASLFSDCTGDGTIGFLAGANWTTGRESRYEYGESLAPEKSDKMVMGTSVQWYSKEEKGETSFPEFSYGIEFNSGNCEKVTMGEWRWETGMNLDQVHDAEKIRDYGLLVVYSNWSFLKNHYRDNARWRNRSLDWVAYIAGKRESRRLLGDHVLTQTDIDNSVPYPDASFTTTWAIDLHFPDSLNSARFPGAEFKAATVHNWIHPYAVPYRCLYSRNIENLFMAGRNISVTHVALGTVRVMRTTAMMGEVVGMAASICYAANCTPREVYTIHLEELKSLMKKGAGKLEGDVSSQRFNLPNQMLDKPKAQVEPEVTGSYSCLTGDTLVVGNIFMERKYVWNGGNLMTFSLTDKKTGTIHRMKSLRPDFVITSFKGKGNSSSYSSMRTEATSESPACLRVLINYMENNLQVRRELRVYDNSPVIVSAISLKGKLDDYGYGGDMNNADRKNIEFAADMKSKPVTAILDRLSLPGNHWRAKAVEFTDITDWNDNLVFEKEIISYRKNPYRGNLLFLENGVDSSGIFFLKEAPSSGVQLHYKGVDFYADFGEFSITAPGVSSGDISMDEWTPVYTTVTGVCSGGEFGALKALRSYQKNIRSHRFERGEMVMMNTWGDRSQDSKVNEAFCLAELDKAAKLGISLFQIDDGWQSGKSPNSAVAKGSFKNIWDNPDYWTPDPVKYPRGLAPIVEKGRNLGIEIGLWFNPSIQNDFADWEKDAEAMISLYKEYGIRVFKIDGLGIPTKRAEINLRKLFDKVLSETDGEVLFNLDATAGRRGGYHFFNEYGNIFLENRYTDWGNYYPYRTLRNLWMLSKYVPAEKIQVEFLNKWRNAGKYGDDPFSPANYSFDYLFAITMAGQPLAWMEASNLPEEAFPTGNLIRKYRTIALDFHLGVILPIGEEPSGRSWTGFQSVKDDRSGYILVLREDNARKTASVKTWIEQGAEVLFEPVLGEALRFSCTIDSEGKAMFSLPQPNSFAMYRYTIR